MVAVIHSSKSIKNTLHYNESKVRQKVASFIHAANYPKDTDLLTFTDKINLLEKYIKLNQQAHVNSVHISLNFDSSDRLSLALLKEIADEYMKGIGFSEQPYLVYQHHDAGHPHIHIVTTNIKNDGRRISLHNLGKDLSERTRRKIENKFQLTIAEAKQQHAYTLEPVDVLRVQYGKSETKRAITTVLNYVLSSYKYTSIAELNAILMQYNVLADTGSKTSRIYGKEGLVYRILDANKQKIGVPIKASLIYNRPTLKNIKANFERNELERQKYKRRVTTAIDFLFLKRNNLSLQALITGLLRENIDVVLRKNVDGIIYGITYVDYKTKCVFNGSDLGKQYSANGLLHQCNMEQTIVNQTEQALHAVNKVSSDHATSLQADLLNTIDGLIKPESNQYMNEPSEQQKFKKRKRKQRLTHN